MPRERQHTHIDISPGKDDALYAFCDGACLGCLCPMLSEVPGAAEEFAKLLALLLARKITLEGGTNVRAVIDNEETLN